MKGICDPTQEETWLTIIKHIFENNFPNIVVIKSK